MSEKKYTKNLSQRQSKNVKILAAGKHQTTQSGIIAMCKYLERIGFKQLFNKELKKPNNPNSKYSYCEVFMLTILSIAAGAESMEGIVYIGQDSVLRKILSWIYIPCATTLSRIYKRFKIQDIYNLESLNHSLRNLIWKKYIRRKGSLYNQEERTYIDIDSTVITVYGKQEGVSKGYNPKQKGKYSYHPLIAFFANTKEILQATLRTGACYTSNGIIGFCQQLFASLPNDKFIIRADSGFFSGDFLSFLEKKQQGYLIKVKINKKLKQLLYQSKWQFVPNMPGWQQCIFEYSCDKWKHRRKFIAVREIIQEESFGASIINYTFGKYNYFCYVTNEYYTPWMAHKAYGKRATCETFIDEAKNQCALAKIRTNNFLANSALFQAAVIAYNSFRWMALDSNNKKLKTWEIKTIRLFIIRVSARLISKARQLILLIPKNFLHMFVFKDWFRIGGGNNFSFVS